MASGQTSNFGLNQWEPGDQVLREEFNADNVKIDGALEQKADRSEITVLSEVIAAKGNCGIFAGSYQGTGTFGPEHPCCLTFDFPPQVIFLDTHTDKDYNSVPEYYMIFQGASKGFAPGASDRNILRWEGNTVSWYYPSTSDSSGSMRQLNESGRTYHYIAIG